MDAANLSWASAPLTRIQAAQGRKDNEETTQLQVNCRSETSAAREKPLSNYS